MTARGVQKNAGKRTAGVDAPENSEMEIGKMHCGRSGGILEPRQRKVPADQVGGHSK